MQEPLVAAITGANISLTCFAKLAATVALHD
jgi:hypothetical protein